ncbi:MAG: pyridoxal phosphate-dependent aminotransferase [Pseudomonadota bacterium]
MTVKLTDIVAGLPATVPFVGPEHQERARGKPFKARIGANESVFGPSPKVVEAIAKAGPEQWMYCDPNMHDLRMAIAEYNGIDPATIVIGEGIDGLFGNTVRLVVGPGDKVVTSLGAYPTFNYHVAGFGGELVMVPYKDDHEDPEALVAAATKHRPKLVFLANPDNPMGTWHSAEKVQALIEALPDGTMLCLDEAYIEFAPDGTAPPWATDDPRVIRFRTFSKAHGMAGLRIAYAVTHPETAAAFDRIRNHFGVNRVAQEAAIAALSDPSHLANVAADVAAARDRIGEIAVANGLTPLPSATNFVAIDCGRDGDYARAVLGALIEQDIFVRMPGPAPLDRCIRVSAGRKPDLDAFAEALPQALAKAGSV